MLTSLENSVPKNLWSEQNSAHFSKVMVLDANEGPDNARTPVPSVQQPTRL